MSGYRGRFAPSPTGPLHFGSLVAAVASYLDARTHSGKWLIRMEDLDTPRCVAGADAQILRTLETCGLEWDETVIRQSERIDLYHATLEQLKKDGRAYGCGCTRREIADSLTGTQGAGETPYPGTCRSGLQPGRHARAWRLRVDDVAVSYADRLQGLQTQNVAREAGDFVLLRADGIWAYQLAVVVDDAAQGITDVVRGADLLNSTPRQIELHTALRLPHPRYLHVPVATNGCGEKLSKQTLAPPAGAESLPAVLRFLGMSPPAGLQGRELLAWAVARWDVTALPAVPAIPLPDGPSLPGSDESPRA